MELNFSFPIKSLSKLWKEREESTLEKYYFVWIKPQGLDTMFVFEISIFLFFAMFDEKLKSETLTWSPLSLFCFTDTSVSLPIIFSRHNCLKDSKFKGQSLKVKSKPRALLKQRPLLKRTEYVREFSA